MKSTFVASEVKEPLISVKNNEDGGGAQIPNTQQENAHPHRCSANENNKGYPILKYQNFALFTELVSDTLLNVLGSAKMRRQPRKNEKRKGQTTR